MNYSRFENIYDRYSPMLYSIALQICGSQKIAEKLIILTFKEIHDQNILHEKNTPYCITLIRLIIKIANEHYPAQVNRNNKLTQFKYTPILNTLIFRQKTLHDYCLEKLITRRQGLDIIRKEFSLIRKTGHLIADMNTILADDIVFIK